MEKKEYTLVISGLPANTSEWVDLQTMTTERIDSEELKEGIRQLQDLLKEGSNVYFNAEINGFQSAVLIPSPRRFLAFRIRSITHVD